MSERLKARQESLGRYGRNPALRTRGIRILRRSGLARIFAGGSYKQAMRGVTGGQNGEGAQLCNAFSRIRIRTVC